MSIREEFEEAVAITKTLTVRPANEILLKLYGLFKQATEGDINGERPGGFDFKGAAKYDAWESEKGKSAADAMQEYINLVNSLDNSE
jgi:diazepam-binding inhibitor (GABA receptor modulator, acyl-CoA-binding protein)